MQMMQEREKKTQRWCVVADYFSSENDRWLDDFIEDPMLNFSKVLPRRREGNWHLEKGRTTSLSRWFSHFSHTRYALSFKPDGFITAFPQLAMLLGLLMRLQLRKVPIIAYHFNLGRLPGGLRQTITRMAAKHITYFIVHSPAEVASYAAYLGVPETRVIFAPLQRGNTDVERDEDIEAPFILSMGSAHRDYPTLIKAVDALRLPTVIVTRPADIENFPSSDYVRYKTHLSQKECRELLARCKLSVTPVSNMETASGQITFVNSLRLGVPTIATRCPGTDGYIEHMKTGILTNPFDIEDLKLAIKSLWDDPEICRTLTVAAVADAQNRFTDVAAAFRLHQLILDTQAV